ncbi:MAG: polyprenyl diphosphate synthase [Candidatus Pacearchaeota archaeon]|jgi:undecaprenyl diphosphate synthase
MRIKVYGRVQFVGFRNKVKNFCIENKINGYVKNLFDGSVLVVIDKNFNEFIDWVKMSPGFSKVTEIKKSKIDDLDYENFEVKKDFNFFIDKLRGFRNLVFLRRGLENIPIHIAIIPDGNRRWAKRRGLLGFRGHEKAGESENLISLFEEARDLGVSCVSFWGFSTENWKREKEENEKLFNVFLRGINDFRNYAKENKVRFRHIGRKERFSKEVRDALIVLENETKNYENYNVQLCLDYGGRDEILRNVNKLLSAKAKKVNEKQFGEILDTKGVPDPDLIVRTSGEKRLSGFMPWQGVYAELIFLKKHFPDFTKKDIDFAIKEFSKRKRRFGGNS